MEVCLSNSVKLVQAHGDQFSQVAHESASFGFKKRDTAEENEFKIRRPCRNYGAGLMYLENCTQIYVLANDSGLSVAW